VIYKDCPAFKAGPDEDSTGQFEAIVSVFNNADRVGDVVLPGAFSETLEQWKASGDPIPVLWSHRMDDPRFSIGAVLEAAELAPGDARIPDWAGQHVRENGGLYVLGKLHTGADATDVSVAARKLLRLRLVKQFSFAYDVIEGGWGKADGEEVFELRKLALHEVSPTQVGCNDLTQLLAAKAHGAPRDGYALADVGRILSKLGDDLRHATAVLGEEEAAAVAPPEAETVTPQRNAPDPRTLLAIQQASYACTY
jgi:uncharacterized protein